MNTRIQVEHGVTEMVTSTDLVKESIRISAGEPMGIKQRQVEIDGAAISAGFTPRTPTPICLAGHSQQPSRAGRPRMRVETALYDGYREPVHYDPLVAKLIVHADSRDLAIVRSESCSARIRNRWHSHQHSAAPEVLEDADFKRGHFATDFLKRYENAPAAPEAIERPTAKAS